MKKYSEAEIPEKAQCLDCGFLYEDPAWIEAVVPNALWEQINPTHSKGCGLLCIQCMAKRCVELGLESAPVMLKGGVLECKPIWDEGQNTRPYCRARIVCGISEENLGWLMNDGDVTIETYWGNGDKLNVMYTETVWKDWPDVPPDAP